MLFLLLTTILSLMGIVSCKDKVITAEKLPATAKSFIEEHFPETPVSFVKKEAKLAGATYEMILKDGTEIEFDAKGEWERWTASGRLFLPVWSPPQSPSMYKAISPASSSS